jgi:2Fe-2S ferredoxin
MIKVTFIEPSGNERTLEGPDNGQSVMELARANGIEGITADCGGACACATCHCYIAEEWRDVVGSPDDVEEMTLDMAPNLRPESRLTCQIQLRAELDGLRVTVAPQ